MDHDEVVRLKMTERYLLDELASEERDQFEEHFFVCPECAMDVRAGSEFVSRTRVILSETPAQEEQRVFVPARRRSEWFNWLRPAYAVPALALLLAIVGYQNLVVYPHLRARAGQPQIMPWATVTVGTWGASPEAIPVQPGKGLVLFLRIPPEKEYASYIADLYSPAGRLECSLTIPTAGAQDQFPLVIPELARTAGTYKIAVRGINAAGESKALGGTSFTLQTQD